MGMKEDFDASYKANAKDDFEAQYDQKASASVPSVKPVRTNPRKSDWKPPADYGTPFNKATGGALIHAGKIMQESISGIKQLKGMTPFGSEKDKEYSQKTQEAQDIYNKYEHPFMGVMGGEALSMLPFISGTPKAVSALGKVTGSQNLKTLGLQMGQRESKSFLPGLLGTTIGAAGAGSYHVNPNLSPEEQARQRMSMILTGGAIGGGADLLGSVYSNRALKQEGQREQRKQSGPLDTTVRTPPARLYPERAADIDRLVRLAKEAPLPLTGSMWTDRAKDVTSRPIKDINTNASSIRTDATNSTGRPSKGAAIEDSLQELRTSNTDMKAIRDELDINAINTNEAVTVPNGKYATDLKSRLAATNKVTALEDSITGEFGNKYNRIIDSVDKTKLPTTSGVGPVKPTTIPMTNLGNLLKAEKRLKNLADASFSNSHSSVAANAAREVRATIDDIIENKAYTSSSKDAVDTVLASDNFRKNYNEMFMADPTIRKAISEKDGGISAQQFTDSLLGSTKRDSIDNFLKIMPEAQGALRQEYFQKMFVNNKSTPTDIDIPEFISKYGTESNRNVTKAVLDPGTISKMDKLHELYYW